MCEKISNIQVSFSQKKSTTTYLTIDIDWAHGEILEDTIDLIESFGSSATWFVTHDTPLLSRLRSNSSFELGIHPNFDFLLSGNGEGAQAGNNAEEVIDRLLSVVPEATSIRSHSTTQSSRLLEMFVCRGITHECNTYIPAQAEIVLKPWRLWSGLVRVPYFWEDDAACLFGDELAMSELVQREGLKVFDFHPIHVFLNTERLSRYERTRPLHHNPKELIKHRFEGYGTRNRLIELLELSRP